MNGDELLRKLRRYAKVNSLEVRFLSGHGKGSHGRIHLGSRYATIKDRKKEIGPGLLAAMLRQLGLTKQDIEE